MPLPVDASLEFQYSIVYSMTCVIALRQGSIKSVRSVLDVHVGSIDLFGPLLAVFVYLGVCVMIPLGFRPCLQAVPTTRAMQYTLTC